MLARTKALKKNPLTKAQNRLLKQSLKNLLGTGLIEKSEKKNSEQDVRDIVLKNALNAIILNS